jgi:hypothetical protein
MMARPLDDDVALARERAAHGDARGRERREPRRERRQGVEANEQVHARYSGAPLAIHLSTSESSHEVSGSDGAKGMRIDVVVWR